MIDFAPFDRRPILVAVAGPNGAGKTTFYHAHLKPSGLRLVNADLLAGELALDPYAAMKAAEVLRRELVRQGESFAFETVFSDPFRDKLTFLKGAAGSGYTVILCYIGIAGPDISRERVAMRVSQGGHDVPDDKLKARYPRTFENLKVAIRELECVLVFDNSDLRAPFRWIASFEKGRLAWKSDPLPDWFAPPL